MPDAGLQVAVSADGTKLHLHHGPIDLIVEADGEPGQREIAFLAARERFAGLLDQLVGELGLLRTPLGDQPPPAPSGPVARRMVEAVAPYRHDEIVSPMAAVAGSVADEIGAAMSSAAPLGRWSVNNGGDIALGLRPGTSYRAGMVTDPRRGSLGAAITIDADSGAGGIATSGRHGRSFSLGIADAVSVLAPTAAAADAAATLIANHVDVGDHPEIVRRPAVELDPDSDLGTRPVVVDVGTITSAEAQCALAAGLATAEGYVDRGLIIGAMLQLSGHTAATAPSLAAPLEATAALAGDRGSIS